MNGRTRRGFDGVQRDCSASCAGLLQGAVAVSVIVLSSWTSLLAQSESPQRATPAVRPPIPPERLPPGIDERTVAAIDRGLAYLARTQDRQGAWANQGGYGSYPVAMTALAGLALLMDGNTTTQGRYAANVDRATRYLTRSTTASGLIARTALEPRPMYGHGFSMLFLSQLYGMTENAERAAELHDILQRAVQLTGRAQSRLGGWIYTPDANSDEGSVTITQVQALRSCRNAGVAVPKSVIDQSMEYLVRSQNSDGGIRYSLSQRGGSSRAPITAAAVCCWFNAGEYDNPLAKRALSYCKANIPPDQPYRGHDFYAHLYMAQALYVSADPDWMDYFTKRRDFLLAKQRDDGAWYGDGVGDIYGTALALVILQLPFNQLPIMQQ
jgi:hypothetical protein